jgi:hypothetical protein
MQNFDPKFKDFPDYILGITKEIWEERSLATLHDYYAKDIIVRTAGSLVVGNESVISATASTLATYPDRTLLGEDVIWSGTPEQGMLSSHRIFSTATTQDRNGQHCKVGYRVIADCHAKNNQIDDEWLVRDESAIAKQLGYSSREYALKQIDDQGGLDNCQIPFTADQDIAGPYLGKGNDDEWGHNYADILTRIMSSEFNHIAKAYDRGAALEYPGGITGHSHAHAEKFWISLRAAFPSATFQIHHQIGRDDILMPPRAAIRWSLTGKHEGAGMFGSPTQSDVHIMGISHAEFGPWGLRREYVLLDEVAVWKQILLHQS